VNLKDIWAKLHSKDLFTWIGHGVVGFVLTWFFGYIFTLGAFLYREVSDLIGWFFEDKETRRPFQDKAKDCFFDLWAPLAGAALAEILKTL